MNEEVEYINKEEDINPVEKYLRDNDVKNNVLEFFLGKNVIAKIAGVLIFLGIVSFGQLAYEWMPDLGRVLLVFAIGLLFGGLGYWFERRKSDVFSNVFYSMSIFIFYLVIMLSRYQYVLITDSVFAYLSLSLMVGVFIYFYNRRYTFLDSVLLIFYMILGFINKPMITNIVRENTVLETTLLVLALGFIIYTYFTKYLNDKLNVKTLMVSVVSFMFIVNFFILVFNFNGDIKFIEILYSILIIFFVYIINMVTIQKATPLYKFVTSLSTTILVLLVSGNVVVFMNDFFSFDFIGYYPLYIAILLIPIYTFNYLKKNETVNNVNLYYLGIIVFTLIYYSFSAGSHGIYNSPYDYYILNLISGGLLIAFFLLSKITKQYIHKVIAYLFMIIFSIRLLSYHIDNQDFIFREIPLILGSLGIGIVLLLINLGFEYYKKERDEYNVVSIQTLNLFLGIPVVAMCTAEWISIDISIIGSIVVLWFIGYRWLMELDIFKMKFKKEFLIGLNIKIVVVVFWVSLMYFDHNFGLFSDVAKFLLVFAINIYIIQALKELYYSKTREMDDEWTFIIIYLIGVLIHSYFIHRYINIEFDKVILSSYFMIASAGGILLGFKGSWTLSRKLGLASIYYSLGKFFIYDFYTQDFSTFVRMVTYFILGFVLLGISFLYAYLEKEYGKDQII